jgi:hypothetical protein
MQVKYKEEKKRAKKGLTGTKYIKKRQSSRVLIGISVLRLRFHAEHRG